MKLKDKNNIVICKKITCVVCQKKFVTDMLSNENICDKCKDKTNIKDVIIKEVVFL